MTVRFQHAGTPNLYVKDGMYYYRRQMTGTIRRYLGMSEIRRSLRTGNIKKARLRCAYIDIKVKTILGNTEKMLSDNITSEMLKVAKGYFKRELQDCLDELDLSPPHMKSVKGDMLTINYQKKASSISNLMNNYSEMATTKNFNSSIMFEIDQCFEELGKDVPSTKANEYRLLGSLICRAKAEAYRIYHAHLTYQPTETSPQDPLFVTMHLPQAEANASNKMITLSNAIEEHKEFKKDEIVLGSKQDYQRVYNWMLEWFGEDEILETFTKPKIRSFKDMLTLMPKNYTKIKGYKKLNLKEMVLKSKSDKKVERNTLSTQKKYFSLVKSFFHWANEEDYIGINPAEKIIFAKQSKVSIIKNRKPFTPEDLNTLIQSPLFTGYASPKTRHIKGNIKKQLPDYWAWLLGLYTGLRIKEIATLHRRDVLDQDGVLCISVNNNHGLGVKTLSSIRNVPIHNAIIELGFLDWIKRTTKGKPNRPIFPTFVSKSVKDPSKRATRRTTPYLRKIGITGTDKVFHSCRHNFADELRNNNLEEYSIKKLLGHSDGGVTGGYGIGASIPSLKEAVDKCYPHLDIEHLKNMKL